LSVTAEENVTGSFSTLTAEGTRLCCGNPSTSVPGCRTPPIAGITPHPDNRWMTQIARNVTDAEVGILRGKRFLILDRDTKYTDEFRSACT
jgi:hypothetical protein